MAPPESGPPSLPDELSRNVPKRCGFFSWFVHNMGQSLRRLPPRRMAERRPHKTRLGFHGHTEGGMAQPAWAAGRVSVFLLAPSPPPLFFIRFVCAPRSFTHIHPPAFTHAPTAFRPCRASSTVSSCSSVWPWPPPAPWPTALRLVRLSTYFTPADSTGGATFTPPPGPHSLTRTAHRPPPPPPTLLLAHPPQPPPPHPPQTAQSPTRTPRTGWPRPPNGRPSPPRSGTPRTPPRTSSPNNAPLPSASRRRRSRSRNAPGLSASAA